MVPSRFDGKRINKSIVTARDRGSERYFSQTNAVSCHFLRIDHSSESSKDSQFQFNSVIFERFEKNRANPSTETSINR